MPRAIGARSQLVGAFETTEKTAPASGYDILPFLTNSLGRTDDLLQDDTVGTRDERDHATDNPTVEGEVEIPIDLTAIGFWLKLLLGAPTTTDNTGVYTHVFESGAWTLPTASFEKQHADVPSYQMFSGVGANLLRYSVSRGGYVSGTVGLIGQAAATPASSTAAGTPTALSYERFRQKQSTVLVGGSLQADLVEFSLEYNNNLDPVDTVTSDGFIGGLDPLKASLSGSMRLRFNGESLYTAADGDTPQAISVVHEITADKKLTLAMPRVFLNLPTRPVTGAAGIEATFNFMASRDTDGSAMLEATLINGEASY